MKTKPMNFHMRANVQLFQKIDDLCEILAAKTNRRKLNRSALVERVITERYEAEVDEIRRRLASERMEGW